MTSNLECVGLGTADRAELQQLVAEAARTADWLGEVDGVTVLRWQDPSGARLVLGLRGTELLDLLPSYAGSPGATLTNVRVANDEVAFADVLDDDGEQVTMLAAEFEQHRLIAVTAEPVRGPAAVVALGVDVSLHADADAFSASPASLLTEGSDEDTEPPEHFVDQGWSWPPRIAAESFISYGVFGDPETAQAYARLSGTVLHAQRHTVAATGQQFVAARVRTAGFEVDLCLPGGDASLAPAAGQIIAGTVFLVASLPVVVA